METPSTLPFSEDRVIGLLPPVFADQDCHRLLMEREDGTRYQLTITWHWFAPRPESEHRCPSCDGPLVEISPGEELTSSPPQKLMGCPDCDYRAFVEAKNSG